MGSFLCEATCCNFSEHRRRVSCGPTAARWPGPGFACLSSSSHRWAPGVQAVAGGSGDVFGAPAVVRCFCSPHELGCPVSTIQHHKHASPRAKSLTSLLCRSSRAFSAGSSRTPTGVLGMRVMRGSAARATERSASPPLLSRTRALPTHPHSPPPVLGSSSLMGISG